MNFNWPAFGLLILYTIIVYIKAYFDGKRKREVKDPSDELEFYKAFSSALNIESMMKDKIITNEMTDQEKIIRSMLPLAMKEAIFRQKWEQDKKTKED